MINILRQSTSSKKVYFLFGDLITAGAPPLMLVATMLSPPQIVSFTGSIASRNSKKSGMLLKLQELVDNSASITH